MRGKKGVKILTKFISLQKSGVITDVAFEFESVKEVIKDGKFIGFEVKWKDTLEQPVCFFESVETLKKFVKRYKNMSNQEVFEDLIKLQNQNFTHKI